MNAGAWKFYDLARLGPRTGPDVRPMLLRVLTELYLQKPTHTADEERHYTELALRLLEAVDAGTRAGIAERLAQYASPPVQVLARLRTEIPGLAAARAVPGAAGLRQWRGKIGRPLPFAAEIAVALNELFFAANADERRLVLLNLDVIAPLSGEHIEIDQTVRLGARMETAILSRNGDAFANTLAQALQISRVQARRLVEDELGEPIVAAAKALNLERGALYRILLFANRRINYPVARIQALAKLHHALPTSAARQMVAIWQSLPASLPTASLSRAERPAERDLSPLRDRQASHGHAAQPASHAAALPASERRGAS